MGRKIPVHIGKLKFESKTGALNYTRKILYGIGLGKVKSTHEHYQFLCDLIENHEDSEGKKGCGIEYFVITQNKMNKSLETRIVRTDGSSIDFSWNSCATCTFPSKEDKLEAAMRNAVHPTTSDFKRSRPSKCENTKCETPECVEFHVDHDDPYPFDTLKHNFLKFTKLRIPTEFDNTHELNLHTFKEEDEEFEKQWIEYHDTYCKLQILCKPCNLKKSKPKQ